MTKPRQHGSIRSKLVVVALIFSAFICLQGVVDAAVVQVDESSIIVRQYWLRWGANRSTYTWGALLYNSANEPASVVVAVELVDAAGVVLHEESGSDRPMAIPPHNSLRVEGTPSGALGAGVAEQVRGLRIRVRASALASGQAAPDNLVVADGALEWIDRGGDVARYNWSATIANPNPFHVSAILLLHLNDGDGEPLHSDEIPLLLPPASSEMWRGTGSLSKRVARQIKDWHMDFPPGQASISPEPVRFDSPGLAGPVRTHMEFPEFGSVGIRDSNRSEILLEAVVTTSGRVANPIVVASSGVDELDARALEAIGRWLFEPGTKNGLPVPVIIEVTFSRTVREERLPAEGIPDGRRRVSRELEFQGGPDSDRNAAHLALISGTGG